MMCGRQAAQQHLFRSADAQHLPMSTSDSPAALDAARSLVERYVHGDAPLEAVIAAFRSLPPGVVGDATFALPGGDSPAGGRALSEPRTRRSGFYAWAPATHDLRRIADGPASAIATCR